MGYLVAGIKHALRLHRPGRTLLIRPDDVFLVSFPKSGNTWTRFLLANLLHPEEPATFANIHRLIPDPSGTTKRDLDRMPSPRIIKSHECFDPRYPRVIYIVRDPRDVVVSQFHYHRKLMKINDGSPIETFVERFLAGETCPHGSWGQNVVTWLATREGDRNFLLLRYEDMVSDTPRELTKIAQFLTVSTDAKKIGRAVEQSSAGRMRKMEAEQTDDCGLTKGSRKDLSFVRAAGSGGWHSDLPEPMIERIEGAWGPLMAHLGYELATQAPSAAPDFAGLGILNARR
ncbi:MAG TPA: sulfotransferase domain-containing protein [Candidatus Solibacter sp.]|nr:sulfotransferase domain-containing protein [Candidatus Solibacter sp.]